MSGELKACPLAECPPGPFEFNGTLGFKTEYGATIGKDIGGGKVEFNMTNWPDAYVMASGEFFWGGVTTHAERAALIVTPIDPDALTRPIPEAERERIARLIYEADPFFESGEWIDGFPVSPGAHLSWHQAQDRDAEFGDDPVFKSVLGAAYALADAILNSEPNHD